MKQDKAERLARDFLNGKVVRDCCIRELCDHILSGDHKREIENAAFERAIQQCGDVHQAGRVIAKRIRTLIQPPAQKENGE